VTGARPRRRGVGEGGPARGGSGRAVRHGSVLLESRISTTWRAGGSGAVGDAVARTKRTTARRRSLRTRTAVEARTCAGRGCWSVELVPDRRTSRGGGFQLRRGGAMRRTGTSGEASVSSGFPAAAGSPSGTSRRPAAPPRRGPFQGESGSAHGTFLELSEAAEATAARASVPDWFPRAFGPAPGLCGTDRERRARSERRLAACSRHRVWPSGESAGARATTRMRGGSGQPRLGRSAGVASGPVASGLSAPAAAPQPLARADARVAPRAASGHP
jgi:hypothetical protein